MKRYINYISILMILIAVVSCKENQVDLYQDDPAIYFAHETYGQRDSINYSFFILKESILRDTIHVKVCTMGMPQNVDRKIKIVQTNVGQPNAAVAGVHFVSFDNPEVSDSICIPAGAVSVQIPIIALRDASLALNTKRLELAVESNDNFRPGIDAWRTFVVKISDMATKPSLWDTRWKYYFGPTWGSVKFKFIIQATDYTEWDVLPSDYSYLVWLMTTAKQALLDYNAAHPDAPLREANGDLVVI